MAAASRTRQTFSPLTMSYVLSANLLATSCKDSCASSVPPSTSADLPAPFTAPAIISLHIFFFSPAGRASKNDSKVLPIPNLSSIPEAIPTGIAIPGDSTPVSSLTPLYVCPVFLIIDGTVATLAIA